MSVTARPSTTRVDAPELFEAEDSTPLELSRPWPDVVSVTTWLPDRPVAVRVDRPADGAAVGALVVVPPFGLERIVAFRALRVLALHAARRGFVAVSPDLPGDGDSPAPADRPFPATWVEAADAAVRYARTATPGRPVHVIGLRVGACVASALPGDAGEQRIQWEPTTGRAAARRLRTVRQRAVDVPVDEVGSELATHQLSPAEAAAFAALTPAASPLEQAAGARGAADSPDAAAGVVASGAPEHVVRKEADRAVASLLSQCAAEAAEVPRAAILEIVEGLPRGAGAPVGQLPCRSTALVAPGVVERLVVLGPRRVRGVVTEPADASRPTTAVLAFTATGAEMATGPGDLWAHEARRLAPYGVRSIRADRSGLADALRPDEDIPARTCRDDAAQDCAEMFRYARLIGQGAPVMGVGICAGPWCLMRAAETVAPDQILAINQVHWAPEASHYDEAFYVRWHGARQARPEGSAPESQGPYVRLRAAALTRWPQLEMLRYPSEARNRVGRMLARMPRDLRIHVVNGEWESRLFVGKGGVRHTQGAQPRLRLTVEPGLDHGAVAASSRRILSRHLDAMLREWGVPGVAA